MVAERVIRLLARVVVAMLVASVLVLVPEPEDVAAQANPRWVCDGTPILMRGGKFHYIVPDPGVPGNLTIQEIPGTSGIANSTGYDPTTNWVYGVAKVGGEKTVRAYDANGDVVFQTQIADPYPDSAGTYAGTVLGDGRYIIHSVGNGNGSSGWYAGARFNLWSIDPLTGAATHIGSTPVNFADFSYNPLDGYLYQVVNRQLYKVNPNDGSLTSTPMPGAFPNGSFGASWFDAAGFLYLFRNNPGDIFKVDPLDTSTWVEVGEPGSNGGTDAASCVSQIDIKKDVVDGAGDPVLPADRVYAAGDTVTYKFTLINNGLPTQGLTADLCDVLPADGRTYTGAWTSTDPGATITSGGAAGDTSVCFEVDMPSSLWTDPANPGAAPTEVTVDVVLGADVLPGVLENQATLDYDQDGSTDVFSDDPGDGSDPRDPTTIQVNGSMEITKTVEGHPVDNAADQFTINLTCTASGGGAHTVQATHIVNDADGAAWPTAAANSFTLTNADRVRVTQIPPGASCTATEVTSPAYATTATSGDGTATASSGTIVIDEASDDELVSFTNRTGTFRLIKRTDVTGSPLPIDEDGQFSFDITCDNGLTNSRTFVTTNGDRFRNFPNTPLVADGAVCTVTEVVPAGWNLTTANDQQVTIASGTRPDVDFTNERLFADLTVTKAIVGLPAGADPTAFSFDVSIECTDGFEPDPYTVPGPLTIATDAPIVVTDLPVGTSCTVTEADDPGFNTRYAPAQTVTVEEGGSSVEITNSTGSLIIEKNTVAPTTHPVDPVADFDFTLDCTYPDTSTTSQNFTVSADALTATGATGGISHTDIGVLPPGTSCTATETALPTGWTLTTPNNVVLDITALDPEPTASFTNTRDTGSLTITKSLVGVPGALDLGDEPFTVDVSCSGGFTVDPYDMNGLTVTANTPLVISDLPTGAACSVTETPDIRFSSAVAPGSVTIDADGEAVTLTNTTSSFSLSKTTTSSALVDDIDGTFTFGIVCTSGATEVANTTVSITTSGGSGAALASELPLVPAGSDCTVTETVPSGWTLTDRTGGTTSGAAAMTLTTTVGGTALAFENTLDTAALTITKDVTGVDATPALEAETFVVNVSCTGNFTGGAWASGAQNLVEGAPVVLPGLPVGAECTVAETADGRFTTTYGPSDTATIAASGNTIAITNETSSFSISKSTSVPADVDPDDTFTFDITCTAGGSAVYTDTITITTTSGTGSWGPPTAPFLAPGTVCEISETAPSGWTTSGASTQTITTSGTSTEDAAFTNVRAVSDLTITKTLLGIPSGLDFSTEPFTVDVTCTGDFAASPLTINDIVITSMTPATVSDLPTGAVCTVVEDFDSRFQTLYSPDIGDGSAAQVTMDADGEEAGVTNSGGILIIRKNTSAPDDHPIDLLVDIDFAIDCGAAFSGTRTVAVDQITGGEGIGGLTYTELPIMPNGTNCTITETVPTGWTVTPSNSQIVTISNDPPTASFMNVRDVGSLTVSKVLDGVPAGIDLGDEAFTVDVSCSGGFTVDPYVIADQTITANTPLVIDNLPTGAVCSVVEDADARFTTAISPDVTIDTDGETITVTNSTSALSITKTTSGTTTHPVDLDGTFTFDIDCGAAYSASVDITTSGQTGTWDATQSPLLPPGTGCEVTEQTPLIGWSLTSAQTVNLTTSSASVSDAAFTNERLVDVLDITKTITGAPIDLSDEEFLVDVSCIGGFASEPYLLGPLTLTENAPIQIADLPVGAACTVTEQADARFTPGYAPDDQVGLIAIGGTEVGIVNRTAVLSVTKEVVAAADQPIDISGSFDIEVSCTDGTNLSLDMDVVDGVAEVKEYPELPLFPDGTACTITELTPPTGWTLTTPNDIEVVLSSETPGDVTFVNRRDTADLTVSKTVLGAPAGLDLSTTTFIIDVTCIGDFESSPLVFADREIKHGETLTFPNLPTGAVCTVVEDADPRFAVSTTPADASTTGVTIDDDGEDVAIVNATGEVMIVKNTQISTAHPVDVTGSFTFNVDCGAAYSGAHIVDATTTTSATTATGFLRYDDIPALPDGADCSVSEQGPPTGWTLASASPVALTVDAAGVQTATFTNTRDTGSLTVTKVLDGVPAGVDLDDETFDIEITCTGDFTGSTHTINDQISVNAPLTVTDLPTGAVCTVTETPDARFTTTISGDATIDADGETITVTNTTSTLSVTKSIAAPGTHPIDADDTFTFDIDCGATYSGTFNITTSAQTGTWATPNTPLLPPGTTCTITEQTPPTGWTLTSANDVDVTTNATTVMGATFTNTRDTGSLTVTKVLDGVPAGVDLDDETFDIEITCTGDFTGSTHTINDQISVNAPLTVTDLPSGAVCTVTETPDPRFSTSIGPDVTIDDDGETITVTNTTSTLSVTKLTTAPDTHPIDADDTFTFDIDCGAAYSGTIDITTTAQTGTWATPNTPLLPPGATCTITEQTPPTGWTLTSANDVDVTTNSATIVDASFVNNRDVATLDVTKLLDGVPVGLNFDSVLFDLTITCTGDFVGGAHTINAQVSVDAPLTVADLPTGADCSVVEAQDTRFEVRYDPANVGDTAAEVTVTDTGAAVEITNVTGAIIISKETVVDTTHPIDPTDTFSFTVDCGAAYNEVHELATDLPTTTGGGIGLLTYAELPVLANGTSCDITELDETPEWALTTDRTVNLIVDATDPVTASFTNERVLGSLVIDKAVDGPDDVDLTDEAFDIAISCSGGFTVDPYEITATVSEANAHTVDALPWGATCTVVEAADDRFATTYTDTDATIVTEAEGGPADLSILNETGSFVIDKETFVDSSRPFGPDDDFTFVVTCTDGTRSYEETVTITTADGMGSWNSPLLPTGHACTVELLPPPGWDVLSTETLNFVVGTGVEVLAFQSERALVDLTVSKTLASIPSGLDFSAREFEITVLCDAGFETADYVIPGDQVVSQTVSVTIEDLPAAASCTVAEAADPDGFFVASYTPTDSIVLAETGSNAVTITNTGTDALATWASRSNTPLAFTGSESIRLLWLGVTLLGAGLLLLHSRRQLGVLRSDDEV